MNHKRGRVKSRRAGCLMCKPHKDQRIKGSVTPEVMGARNFRLTQDRLSDLFAEESRPAIDREIEASMCEDRLCDCGNNHEDEINEMLFGETAKKLEELNVTVTWTVTRTWL